MFLALQGTTVPEQFGAVLVLEPRDTFDVTVAREALSGRVRAVPRLRQRVMRVPLGCGRPVWADDSGFRADRHVAHIVCRPPGDETALLTIAEELVTRPLPLNRPLWAAAIVTGLAHGRVALIVVLQHALADGIGGLAVLGALVDGAPASPPAAFPTPPPSAGRLAADAFRVRLRGAASMPGRIRAVATAARRGVRADDPPRASRVGRAAPCSLLRPTGPRRRITVARAALDDVRTAAHRHGATVNDLLLTAIGGALHTTLRRRGEHIPAVIVGLPVTERRTATTQALGNRFREIRAAVPGDGEPLQRLERVASIMRVRKRSGTGAGGRVASALVRLIIRLGVYEWYMRRQRYLHTVVTNVRGPGSAQTFCGASIVDILPLAVGGGGNVTVSYAALSYAGTLTVSVTADPGRMPDLALATAALQDEFDQLTAHARAGPDVTAGPDALRPP
jgi:WS/DGAT/MGAT family acyltransferase